MLLRCQIALRGGDVGGTRYVRRGGVAFRTVKGEFLWVGYARLGHQREVSYIERIFVFFQQQKFFSTFFFLATYESSLCLTIGNPYQSSPEPDTQLI